MTLDNASDFLSLQINEDFKAEVVAAEMVEHGFPADQIIIRMLGGLKRTYRKDVDSVVDDDSGYAQNNYRTIKTPKEGIYDMLPEGLFHSVSLHQSVTSQREVLATIKKHATEERNARNFFVPFEGAINNLRIQMALYENRLDKRTHYDELSAIFAGNWEIFNYMDAVQANIFVQLLPIIHDIRDNFPIAETVFELILGLPVSITASRRMPMLIENPIISTMDDSTLGLDCTTGNVLFDDGDDEIAINIGPMNKEQLGRFAPGSNSTRIFNALCDYLLPVHLDVSTEFKLLDADKVCVLSDDAYALNNTLGMSTYL